jgi:hypothetical protein
MQPPSERQISYENYGTWRSVSLSRSLEAFDAELVNRKDVLDFGCGDGELVSTLRYTNRRDG